MKLFKYINLKDPKERKPFLYALLIAVTVGQLVALVSWYVFDENFFIILFLSSIVGILPGYRGKKES
jgi:hypothetical protein